MKTQQTGAVSAAVGILVVCVVSLLLLMRGLIQIARSRSLEEAIRIGKKEFTTVYISERAKKDETSKRAPSATPAKEPSVFYEGSLDWKYTQDDGDLDCLTNWNYYASDKKTLLVGNIARTTTKNKKKKWCATKGPTLAIDRVEPDTTTAEKAKTALKDNAGTIAGTAVGMVLMNPSIMRKIVASAAFESMKKAMLGFATKQSAAARQSLGKVFVSVARSAGRLAGKLGITIAAKAAATAASKIGASAAIQAGAKMDTAAASSVAASANIAMAAFTAVSMGLDIFDAGGYGEMQTKKTYFDMKKVSDANFKKAMFEYLRDVLKEANVEFTENDFIWPMVYDPLSDLPEGEFDKKVEAKIAAQLTKDSDAAKKVQADIASGKIKEEDLQNDEVLETYVDIKSISDTVYAELRAANGGFLYEPGKCTLKEDKCSKWPISKDEIYKEFRDGKCVLSDSTIRAACDSAKLEYDQVKGICKIDEAYCKTKGAKWKLNKSINETDCTIPTDQKVLEAIFGTTVVRGLIQVFDKDQYESCGYDGEFKNEDKCLTTNSRSLNNGSNIVGVDCKDAGEERHWYYNSKYKTVHSMLDYKKCWDVPGGKFDKGSRIQVWDCNGTDAQKFMYDPETKQTSLKAASDKCLRLRGNGSVEVSDCANAPDRKFDLKRHLLSDAGLTCDFKKRRPADCPPKYTNNGATCGRSADHKTSDFGHGKFQAADCPSGYTNLGATCEAKVFGRGARYPWKYGDGLNDKGMYKRCEKDHGKGNCEKNGAIVYPKCTKLAKDKGYNNWERWDNVGCCLCSLPLNMRTLKISEHGKCPPRSDHSGKYTQLNKSLGLCYVECGKAYGDEYYNNGTSCWRDVSTKGMGSMTCKVGEKKIGAECERPCPTGYTNMVATCHRRTYRKHAFSKQETGSANLAKMI